MNPVNTVFIGTSYEGESILRSLNEHRDFRVVGVVTQPDRPVGRHQEMTPSDIKQVANELGLRGFEPNGREENYEKIISKVDPELVVVIAFGEFLPDVILDYPKYKCLNIHYSLLPQLRGACPVQMAIMKGLEKTGVTVQIMEHDMDVGPVLAQREIKISDTDTTETLKEKLIPAGRDLLMSMLPKWISGQIKPEPQDHDKATYCYRKDISKEAAQIDWENENPDEIERKVRALQPWPVAWTMVDGKRLKIFEVEVVENKQDSEPGQLIEMEGQPAFGTNEPDKKIILKKVQLEGKTEMSGKEFLRGVRF